MEQHLCFSVEEVVEAGNDHHQTAKPAVRCVQGSAQNEVHLIPLPTLSVTLRVNVKLHFLCLWRECVLFFYFPLKLWLIFISGVQSV